jgi:hypothetical protein
MSQSGTGENALIRPNASIIGEASVYASSFTLVGTGALFQKGAGSFEYRRGG